MSNEVHYKTVTSEEEGQRLDNYLIRILKGVPKSRVYRLIRGGEVRVNKKRAKASSRLFGGDLIRIPPVRTTPTPEKLTIKEGLATALNKRIIYEDERLLVLNKPSGMAVHGGSGVQFGVIEALRAMRPDAKHLELIHRLDRETSGCLLIAKRRSMLRAVQALFEARTIQKTYWFVALNPWHGKQVLRVSSPLQKNTLQSGERMVHIHPDGKPSETRFKLLENYADACWIEAQPKTGRTHQIRVHAVHVGHPILGDVKYGKAVSTTLKQHVFARLYLHAHAIQFTLDETPYVFQAEPDDQFEKTLQFFRSTQ
jgi:23S rRNA pseudouridine955/2504/2580 synthase